MKYDVLVSGMMVVDLLIELPAQYTKGSKQEVRQISVQGGAPAGNAACVIASSGISTAFLGYKSDTVLSHIAIQEFERCNVDTSLLLEKDKFQPAIAAVEVDPVNGERTVFYSLNGYMPLAPEDIYEVSVKNCRLILVDGYDVAGNLALLKLAKKHKITSVLDLEAGNSTDLLQMIQLGGHIILPLEGAQFISGQQTVEDCLFALAKETKGQLVVTDGVNGSWALENGNIIHQPAFPTNAIDTTGCGDAFHGAYAIALLSGKTLRQRLQYATAYASIIATFFGGRSYYPSQSEVESLIIKYQELCQ
ncbi:ribokinase [Fulvivirga sp. M361]|uniref:carbohydrate kinase family protein n=1 Tax=Fulvivirga sp. M361 TaxID=2594266 RepID=UPI001179DB47|nr:PfkB family carbohydrate kinase [Fulvivirga sp. M361]TRX60142.1 ribokinase [Fulvivirga sp. M361]